MVTARLVYGHLTGSGGSPRQYAQSPRSGVRTSIWAGGAHLQLHEEAGMPNRTDQSPPPPIPVADDANATPAQLLNHAAIDYANAQAVTREHQTQGGTGVREGLLLGGPC